MLVKAGPWISLVLEHSGGTQLGALHLTWVVFSTNKKCSPQLLLLTITCHFKACREVVEMLVLSHETGFFPPSSGTVLLSKPLWSQVKLQWALWDQPTEKCLVEEIQKVSFRTSFAWTKGISCFCPGFLVAHPQQIVPSCNVHLSLHGSFKTKYSPCF